MKLHHILCLMLLLISSFAHAKSRVYFLSEVVAPFYYLDNQGKPQGVSVDLVKAMQPILPFSSTVEHMPWARAYQEAIDKPNIVLLTILKSPKRTPQFQWIGPISSVDASLISLKDTKIDNAITIEDAKQYRVGTIRGYGAAAYLLEQGFEENKNLVLVAEPHQLWNLLYKKRIDFAASGFETSKYEIQAAGFNPAQTRQALKLNMPNAELYMATGLRTQTFEVVSIMDALQQLKENGEYDRIMKKWGLSPLHSTHSAPPATLEQDGQRFIN